MSKSTKDLNPKWYELEFGNIVIPVGSSWSSVVRNKECKVLMTEPADYKGRSSLFVLHSDSNTAYWGADFKFVRKADKVKKANKVKTNKKEQPSLKVGDTVTMSSKGMAKYIETALNPRNIVGTVTEVGRKATDNFCMDIEVHWSNGKYNTYNKKHLKVLKKQPWHDLKVGDYVIPTELLFGSSLIGKVCQVVTVEPLTYTGNLPIKIQELESGSYAWCKEFTPVTTVEGVVTLGSACNEQPADFTIGQPVALSDCGIDRFNDCRFNPHKGIGIVTKVPDKLNPYEYTVDWGTVTNTYLHIELRPIEEGEATLVSNYTQLLKHDLIVPLGNVWNPTIKDTVCEVMELEAPGYKGQYTINVKSNKTDIFDWGNDFKHFYRRNPTTALSVSDFLEDCTSAVCIITGPFEPDMLHADAPTPLHDIERLDEYIKKIKAELAEACRTDKIYLEKSLSDHLTELYKIKAKQYK